MHILRGSMQYEGDEMKVVGYAQSSRSLVAQCSRGNHFSMRVRNASNQQAPLPSSSRAIITPGLPGVFTEASDIQGSS